MKHPAIESLRGALRDLLCASEDYVMALARPSVSVVVARDEPTRDDLVRKARELSVAREHARGVLLDLAERLAEDERETLPCLPDEADDATEAARVRASEIPDDEIDARARRASRVFGGRS